VVIRVNVTYHAAEGVAVNAQSLGSFRLIAMIPGQGILDKPPLKFSDCVFKVNAMLNHLVNEGVELILHSRSPTGKIP
jgi:hypothetical protein